MKRTTAATQERRNRGRITAKRPVNIALDLSWNNGEDVVVYDVKDKTPFVSYYIVCSAQTERRLQSLVSCAEESLFNNYHEVDHVEGKDDSRWMLVDGHDIVIQLFTREERKRIDFDAIYEDCPHKVVVAEREPVYRKRKRPNQKRP